MPLRQGTDLALDRILKTAEVVEGVPEPEQLERRPTGLPKIATTQMPQSLLAQLQTRPQIQEAAVPSSLLERISQAPEEEEEERQVPFIRKGDFVDEYYRKSAWEKIRHRGLASQEELLEDTRRLMEAGSAYTEAFGAKGEVLSAGIRLGEITPIVGTVLDWDRMTPTERAISIAIDAAILLPPVVRPAVRGIKAAAGAAKTARPAVTTALKSEAGFAKIPGRKPKKVPKPPPGKAKVEPEPMQRIPAEPEEAGEVIARRVRLTAQTERQIAELETELAKAGQNIAEIKTQAVREGVFDAEYLIKLREIKEAIKVARKPTKAIPDVAPEVSQRITKEFPKTVVDKVKAPKTPAEESLKQAVIETDTALEKLRVSFRERKPARGAIEVIKKEVRGERAAKLEQISETAKTPEEFLARSREALKGKFARPPVFEALPKGALTNRERGLVHDYIVNHPVFYEDQYGKFRMVELVFNDIMRGGIPTKGEFKSLEKVFGWDFTEAIARHGSMEKAWRVFMDITGLPKALKATADLSYSLRQAIFIGTAHPRIWGRAFNAQVKGFARQPWYDDAQLAIKSHADFNFFRKLRLEYTEVGTKAQRLTFMEEAFPTRLADKIPIMKQSSRAAAVMSNKARWDTAFQYKAKFGSLYPEGHEAWEGLVKMLNAATGRGNVPKNLLPAFEILNRVFFSPRFALTPFQMVYYPFRYIKNPLVRRFALRSWMGFIGLNVSFLGLGKLAGLWDVELDRTSSNVGRARVGDTRFDLWHGYLPWMRLISRIVTGTTKTESGEIKDINRADLTVHTIRGKLDPITAAVWDLLEGRSYIGEEFPPKQEDLPRALRDRLLPMAVNDVWDAYESELLTGAFIGGGAALLGANVASYPSRTFDTWADWMAETQNKEWSYEELQAIRMQFNETQKDWLEYSELVGRKARQLYRKSNPEIEADMYFWGEVTSLSTDEARDKFMQLLAKHNLPEEAFPIRREELEAFEPEGKTEAEVFQEFIDRLPGYLANFVWDRKDEWQQRDLANDIAIAERLKAADQTLLDRYTRMTLGEDTKFRQAYRHDHPDIDAALNFWGRVSTAQSVKALELIRQKADQLGIPHDAIPALTRKVTPIRPTTPMGEKFKGLLGR